MPGSAKSRIYADKHSKRGFSKKDLRVLILFRFLWIFWRPGMLNWEWVFFSCIKTCMYKQRDLIRFPLWFFFIFPVGSVIDELHSPPVDLFLIIEKSSWKNQVWWTRFLVYFKLDFYSLFSLQKSISKLIFAG